MDAYGEVEGVKSVFNRDDSASVHDKGNNHLPHAPIR